MKIEFRIILTFNSQMQKLIDSLLSDAMMILPRILREAKTRKMFYDAKTLNRLAPA